MSAITAHAQSRTRPRLSPRAALGLVLAAKVVVTLATDSRYGWHRDELYYVATGRHLAFGYVDFPSVTPVLARVSHALFGDSLVGLRVLPLIAGVGVVALTVLMARELGGGPRAQLVAGLALVTSSFFLGADALFQPVPFDQLTWALCLYVLVRLVLRGNEHTWIAFGAAVGVAFWTKYTIIALLAAVAVGYLATGARSQLRSRGPWLAAIVALAIAAPNIAWQATHHWASIDFLRRQNAEVRKDYPPPRYVIEQIVALGPVVLALSIVGFRRLWRSEQLRPLAWLGPVVVLWYLVLRGKSYYPLTVYPVLVAAGAVAVEEKGRSVRAWTIALVIGGLVALPATLPVLPLDTAIRAHIVDGRDDWKEELGWRELVRTTAMVFDRLPAADRARAVILGRSYSDAGAVDLFGPRYGLPRAYSGHNTYWWWGPPPDGARPVIAVGFAGRRLLDRYLVGCARAATLDNRHHVDNMERGWGVWVCDGPRASWSATWPRLRAYG